MKIYTKLTIDMRTLEVIDEESYDYNGQVAECKGGGGGGGTGKVDYPDYMETMHSTWLTDVDGYMNSAIGNSPFTTATSYDPDTDLTAMDAAVTAFNTVVDAINATTYYVSASNAVYGQIDDNVISTTKVDALIAAHALVIDSDYDDMVTKLQSGMRDVGAAMTSSFVVGQADLYAKKERVLADFGKDLYVQLEKQRNQLVMTGTERVMQMYMDRANFESQVAQHTANAKRIRIIAKGEQTSKDYEYDMQDAYWDLSVTQYGANMMASIGGGVGVGPDMKKISKTESAMAGAMAGASIGAASGTGWGVAIGAVVGGIGGYLAAD